MRCTGHFTNSNINLSASIIGDQSNRRSIKSQTHELSARRPVFVSRVNQKSTLVIFTDVNESHDVMSGDVMLTEFFYFFL